MKNHLLTLICVLLFTTLNAQHQLIKIWETDTILKVPESVYLHSKTKILFTSNIDGKDPWNKDGVGSISKVGFDGKIIKAEWVTGLNAPNGTLKPMDQKNCC
jgi:hypothetical protein